MAQTKHITEAEARNHARAWGNEHVQIVESKTGGQRDIGPFVFYLESEDSVSMIRNWERLVYSGPGRKA